MITARGGPGPCLAPPNGDDDPCVYYTVTVLLRPGSTRAGYYWRAVVAEDACAAAP